MIDSHCSTVQFEKKKKQKKGFLEKEVILCLRKKIYKMSMDFPELSDSKIVFKDH